MTPPPVFFFLRVGYGALFVASLLAGACFFRGEPGYAVFFGVLAVAVIPCLFVLHFYEQKMKQDREKAKNL